MSKKARVKCPPTSVLCENHGIYTCGENKELVVEKKEEKKKKKKNYLKNEDDLN